MRTIHYNPSQLEQAFASALAALQPEIEGQLHPVKIVQVSQVTASDNPTLVFGLQDPDGDRHELVVQIIQRPDNLPGF